MKRVGNEKSWSARGIERRKDERRDIPISIDPS